MSMISETSIYSDVKTPSLVFPSLSQQRNQNHPRSDIYYASQLIKLRSELRSSATYYHRSSLQLPTINNHTVRPLSMIPICHDTDDESEIMLKQTHTYPPQDIFHASGRDYLTFSSLPKKEEEEDDVDSLSSSDTEEIIKQQVIVEDCHSYNKRILERRRQNKPQAFFVSISPSSAAAATIARSRRMKFMIK